MRHVMSFPKSMSPAFRGVQQFGPTNKQEGYMRRVSFLLSPRSCGLSGDSVCIPVMPLCTTLTRKPSHFPRHLPRSQSRYSRGHSPSVWMFLGVNTRNLQKCRTSRLLVARDYFDFLSHLPARQLGEGREWLAEELGDIADPESN